MQFIDLKAQQNQKLQGGITLKEDIEKNIKKVLRRNLESNWDLWECS